MGMCVHDIYPLWRTGPMEAKIRAEGGQTGGGWTFNFLPRCTFAEEWFCNNASGSVATDPLLSGKKRSCCFERRDVRLCTVTDSAEPNSTYCNRLHTSTLHTVCTVQRRRNSYLAVELQSKANIALAINIRWCYMKHSLLTNKQ